MRNALPGPLAAAQRHVHIIASVVVAGLALALGTLSLAAAFGLLPWLDLRAGFGDAELANAGQIAQLALTGLAVALVFFLPGQARLLRLEAAHRDFSVSMEDVAAAYRASHAADRAGLFRLSSEFDSVRERLRHLREHPDLGALEPEVLELAAQMSHTSRGLAEVYSEAKVARARTFLAERQKEADATLETLALAQKTVADLKHWMGQIEAEESVIERQIAALERDLFELLPALGFDLEPEPEPEHPARLETVVPIRPSLGKTPSRPEA